MDGFTAFSDLTIPSGFINHFVLNNTALLLPAIVDPATLYKAQG